MRNILCYSALIYFRKISIHFLLGYNFLIFFTINADSKTLIYILVIPGTLIDHAFCIQGSYIKAIFSFSGYMLVNMDVITV